MAVCLILLFRPPMQPAPLLVLAYILAVPIFIKIVTGVRHRLKAMSHCHQWLEYDERAADY